jgi:hypothetical protein
MALELAQLGLTGDKMSLRSKKKPLSFSVSQSSDATGSGTDVTSLPSSSQLSAIDESRSALSSPSGESDSASKLTINDFTFIKVLGKGKLNLVQIDCPLF